MNKNECLLANIIKEKLLEKGINLQMLSQFSDIQYSTLRTNVSRNTFKEDNQTFNVLKFLGIATESDNWQSIKKKYIYKSIKQESRKNTMENRLNNIRAMKKNGLTQIFDFSEQRYIKTLQSVSIETHNYVSSFFENMESGDACIFICSDILPFELLEQGFYLVWEELCRAIIRGCFFLYLFPNSNIQSSYLQLNVYVPNYLMAFEEFKTKISQKLQKLEISQQQTIQMLNQISYCFVDIPFFVPGQKFALYLTKKTKRYQLFGSFQMPASFSLQKDLSFPLLPETGAQVIRGLKIALAKEKHNFLEYLD